jgi:hypothetical protein
VNFPDLTTTGPVFLFTAGLSCSLNFPGIGGHVREIQGKIVSPGFKKLFF